jgi:GTPase SAR1 family protein
MNSPQSKNNQQPLEKTNKFLSIFSPKKPQQSSIRIGIWGTTGAGKTIYLARLYDLLQQSRNWIFDEDTEAKVFAQQYLNDMNNETKEGTLPRPNYVSKGAEYKIFIYTLTSKNSPFKIELEFIDAPGEFFENPDFESELTVSGGQKTYGSIRLFWINSKNCIIKYIV